MHRKSFLLTGGAALLASCSHASPTAHFEDIAGNGDPLKSAFNNDANKVRIVMLVSPT